jgi:hypothetical protein
VNKRSIACPSSEAKLRAIGKGPPITNRSLEGPIKHAALLTSHLSQNQTGGNTLGIGSLLFKGTCLRGRVNCGGWRGPVPSICYGPFPLFGAGFDPCVTKTESMSKKILAYRYLTCPLHFILTLYSFVFCRPLHFWGQILGTDPKNKGWGQILGQIRNTLSWGQAPKDTLF